MKTFLKVKEVNSVRDLYEIDLKELQFLWYSDWWDGPVSGMLMYRGKREWFQLLSESERPAEEKFYRRYVVIELSEEQIKEKEFWQNLFVEKVGDHMIPNPDGSLRVKSVMPTDSGKEYYELQRNRQQENLSENRVIGFFETT